MTDAHPGADPLQATPAADAHPGADPLQGSPAGAVHAGPTEPPPSMMEQAGRILASPLIGAAKLANFILPIPGVASVAGADKMERYNEERIKAGHGPGVDWERMALDVANPVNYVGAGVGRALGLAPKVAALLAGAVTGLMSPTPGATGLEYGKEKLEQAGVGAAAGKAGDVVATGVSKAIAPTLSPAAKAMADLGIRLTPGQMAGGAVKRAEDSLMSEPLVGGMIREAHRTSIEDFNRAALNKALEPIGAKLPSDAKAGYDGIGSAQRAISSFYENVLDRVTFRADQQLADDLKNLHSLVKEMPPAQVEQFTNILQNRVIGRLDPTGTMDGQTFKQVESELTNLAMPFRQSPDAAQQQLGRAITELRASLRENLERTNPSEAEAISKANAAYAMLSRVEDASMVRATGDGVFTPADLLRAVRTQAKRSGQKKAYARGDSMMQSLASDAQQVLPSKVPDSGTPERAMWAGLTSGALFASPHVAAGLGATALPYTKAGMGVARRVMQPGAARRAAAGVVRDATPWLAPGVESVAHDLGVTPGGQP